MLQLGPQLHGRSQIRIGQPKIYLMNQTELFFYLGAEEAAKSYS